MGGVERKAKTGGRGWGKQTPPVHNIFQINAAGDGAGWNPFWAKGRGGGKNEKKKRAGVSDGAVAKGNSFP